MIVPRPNRPGATAKGARRGSRRHPPPSRREVDGRGAGEGKAAEKSGRSGHRRRGDVGRDADAAGFAVIVGRLRLPLGFFWSSSGLYRDAGGRRRSDLALRGFDPGGPPGTVSASAVTDGGVSHGPPWLRPRRPAGGDAPNLRPSRLVLARKRRRPRLDPRRRSPLPWVPVLGPRLHGPSFGRRRPDPLPRLGRRPTMGTALGRRAAAGRPWDRPPAGEGKGGENEEEDT